MGCPFLNPKYEDLSTLKSALSCIRCLRLKGAFLAWYAHKSKLELKNYNRIILLRWQSSDITTYSPRNLSQVCFIKILLSTYSLNFVLSMYFMLITNLCSRCYFYSYFMVKEPILRWCGNLLSPGIKTWIWWIWVSESRTGTFYHHAYSHN